MDHQEVRESLAAYALDALGPLDRAEVRAHLETCAECDGLYKENAEAVALFSLTIEPASPPRELKASLMKEVCETEQALPLSSRWRFELPRGALALTAAAVLVAGFYTVMLQDRFVRDAPVVPEVVALLASSSVYSVPMVATEAAPQASGQIFVPDAADSAAVVLAGLHDPGDGVYLLWMSVDGQSIPITSFAPDADGKAIIYVARDLDAMESMSVTLEPTPRSRTPKGPFILRSS